MGELYLWTRRTFAICPESNHQEAPGWGPEPDTSHPPPHRVTARPEEGTRPQPLWGWGSTGSPGPAQQLLLRGPTLAGDGAWVARPGGVQGSGVLAAKRPRPIRNKGPPGAIVPLVFGHDDDVSRTPRVRARLGKLRPKGPREPRSHSQSHAYGAPTGYTAPLLDSEKVRKQTGRKG